MVFASNPLEISESTAASSAPGEDLAEAETPAPLTELMLANAITGHVGRDAQGQTPSGYDYYPASVWLNLEASQLAQIASAE